MELIPGTPLTDRLSTPLPVDETLRLGRQIAAALEAAHEQGVVHRDLKLENVTRLRMTTHPVEFDMYYSL